MAEAKFIEVNNNQRPLNIAMIGHKRIPSREGGIEVVVQQLSTRLVYEGHNVTVYSRRGHHVCGEKYDGYGNNVNLQDYKGVKIITVPTIEKKGLAAVTSSFFATVKAIFKKYDCIHYHAEGPSVMLWLPHILGIRTVVTIHGIDWKRSKWSGFATKYLKFGEKIAAKYADEIIVLSNNVKKYFKDTYNRDTVFIPNGVEQPEIKDAQFIKKKWNLDKNDYILYLGRIVPEKGIHYLIDAFKNVNTEKKLVIAGGASDTDEYFKEIKKKAIGDDRIMFTGFVEGQALEELYSNAYIYVLPSDLEGMPMSLLEAMSYGNCCIVSDISECTEVVEEKGVIFKKGNVEDLREKLVELCIDEDSVKHYKESSAAYMCNKYNWDDVTVQTLDLYRIYDKA